MNRRRLLFGASLGLIVLAYSNCFKAPFVFDDLSSIVDNPAIRHLRPLSRDLFLPQENTVAGRPVLSVSFALNNHWLGSRPAGFHLINLLLHLAAAALLFGVLRRTLARLAGVPDWISGAIALWWAAHPLQTESVTYIVQRAESLASLAFLATLYAFIRSLDTQKAAGWRIAAVAACGLGMASKEIVVSAPLVVWLYDRCLVAGSFAEAWRRRRAFYLSLAATWIILILCVSIAPDRSGSAGFSVGVPWWHYALFQLSAIAHYLRLVIWPFPLVFYYGPFVPPNVILTFWPVFLGGLVVVGLLAATIWALRRRPGAGFLGATFFLILAPTSSVLPISTEAMAEHRMYLPLAAVLAALGWVLYRANRRLALGAIGCAIAASAVLTFARNRDYRSELSLWQDTVIKRPANFAARNDLGLALLAEGDPTGARAQFARALALQPRFPDAWINVGKEAQSLGRLEDAEADYRRALALRPGYAEALNDLGAVELERPGREAPALADIEAALRSSPNLAGAHNNLGNALAREPQGRAEAIAEYRRALFLRPDYAEAHYNLANVLSQNASTLPAALSEYRTALAADPRLEPAHLNLGNALTQLGQSDAAAGEFRRALALKPKDAQAHLSLGTLLAARDSSRLEGIDELRAAIACDPSLASAHANLGAALYQEGQIDGAIAETELALKYDPALAGARHNLDAFRGGGEAMKRLAGMVVAVGTVLAYSNSLSGPFVFDDVTSIADNATLRHLWPLARVLTPPADGTTTGRPFLNLSFALNYAVGQGVIGYHLVNLLIHVLAALVLFGILRAPLARSNSSSDWLAAGVALLWAVHPLQTESVTYLAQRAESLMGLFYLLTLYCFLRDWRGLSLAACLLGMATKEVMVSAPVVVLMYDRTFVAGSFAAAWKARRGYYCGLAATWLVLLVCVVSAGSRNGSAGFALGLPWWRYALIQLHAIPLYLRLTVWPSPLIFYYGPLFSAPKLPIVVIGALVVALLAAATVMGLVRRSPFGFLGASFFLLLAPASSIVPIATEPIAEHRMYLPLALVLAALLVGLYRAGPKLCGTLLIAAVPAAAALTWSRNQVFRTETGLWTDTVAKRPSNFLAYNGLGIALARSGKPAAATAAYEKAIDLKPDYIEPWINLGELAVGEGDPDRGAADYEHVLETAGRYSHARGELALAEYELANLLLQRGRALDAAAHYEAALRYRPEFPEAELNLGNISLQAGNAADAIVHYRAAIRILPGYADAHHNLAVALARAGQIREAASESAVAAHLDQAGAQTAKH